MMSGAARPRARPPTGEVEVSVVMLTSGGPTRIGESIRIGAREAIRADNLDRDLALVLEFPTHL